MLLSEHVSSMALAFIMTEQVEQWICIKFCIKLEHSFTETVQMIQIAVRDDAMSAAQINVAQRLLRWLKIC